MFLGGYGVCLWALVVRGRVDRAEGPAHTRAVKVGRLILLGGMPAGGVFLGKWAILAAVRTHEIVIAGGALAISVFVAISIYLKLVMGMVTGKRRETRSTLLLGLMAANCFLLVLVAGGV